jgi:hypothetical protein
VRAPWTLLKKYRAKTWLIDIFPGSETIDSMPKFKFNFFLKKGITLKFHGNIYEIAKVILVSLVLIIYFGQGCSPGFETSSPFLTQNPPTTIGDSSENGDSSEIGDSSDEIPNVAPSTESKQVEPWSLEGPYETKKIDLELNVSSIVGLSRFSARPEYRKATIFYPDPIAFKGFQGNKKPCSDLLLNGKWPVIVHTPGNDFHPIDYTQLGRRLASHGIVLAVHDYPNSMGVPDASLRASLQTNLVTYLKNSAKEQQSDFYNQLGGKFFLMGHSWGGLSTTFNATISDVDGLILIDHVPMYQATDEWKRNMGLDLNTLQIDKPALFLMGGRSPYDSAYLEYSLYFSGKKSIVTIGPSFHENFLNDDWPRITPPITAEVSRQTLTIASSAIFNFIHGIIGKEVCPRDSNALFFAKLGEKTGVDVYYSEMYAPPHSSQSKIVQDFSTLSDGGLVRQNNLGGRSSASFAQTTVIQRIFNPIDGTTNTFLKGGDLDSSGLSQNSRFFVGQIASQTNINWIEEIPKRFRESLISPKTVRFNLTSRGIGKSQLSTIVLRLENSTGEICRIGANQGLGNTPQTQISPHLNQIIFDLRKDPLCTLGNTETMNIEINIDPKSVEKDPITNKPLHKIFVDDLYIEDEAA